MSFYSIPSLFSFISYLLLSIYLLIYSIRKSRSHINWLFLATSTLTAFYSFTIFISKNIYNPETSYYWIKASYLSMIYILPVLIISIYYFTFNHFPRLFYFILLLIEIPIFHLLLSSDLLFEGVERTFYGFRELRGGYYPYFLALLFFFELLVIFIFFVGLKKIKNPLKKAQLLFLLYGFLLIFILSSIIQIGLPYSANYKYYFSYFSFVLFLASFLIWYLFVKYKFLGINIIIKKGTIYLFIIGLFIFLYIMLMEAFLPFKTHLLYNYAAFLIISLILSMLYIKYSKIIIQYSYSFLFSKEHNITRASVNLEILLNKQNSIISFKNLLLKNTKSIFALNKAQLAFALPPGMKQQALNSNHNLFIKEYLEIDPYEMKRYSHIYSYLGNNKLSGILLFKYARNLTGIFEFQYSSNRVFKEYETLILSQLGRAVSLKLHNIQLNEKISKKKYFEIVNILHSSIVHDIKNTITYLNLFSQNIKKFKHNKKISGIMSTSLKNSFQRLHKLKNKLMFAGAVQSRKKAVQIDKYIKNYIRNNYYLFDDHNINLGLNTNSKIYIDPENIKFILDNILINARESISQKDIPGRINIDTLKAKNSILIKIRDNGIGIELKEMKNLLRPFYTSKEKGLGMGLYICSKLLKQNKASLFIKSKANKFTEVILEFPEN